MDWFDYSKHGVYWFRLVAFLVTVFGGVVVYVYLTGQSMVTGVVVTIGVLAFIVFVGKLAEMLGFKVVR